MGAGEAAIAETHSAVVCFLGDRAYKVKKAVDLGFLDFRAREVREAVCHREVELNRRLAPDVYLGVADVVGPDGEVCDHLVVMRRMPDDRRLSTLVRAGAPVADHLWHVAHQLATLHARSARSAAADEAAGPEATRARWASNTAEMLTDSAEVLDPAAVQRADALAERFLTGRHRLLEHRVAAGRAVDGHGDLLADDVFCLDDGPRVLDCIEFDDRLRVGDGLADAAFLAMDLEHLGRPDLGAAFLGAYAEHAGDTWPAALAHHQIAYRAQVRAKVTAIRALQGDHVAAARARQLLDLALEHLERGRVRLVVVGGLPGTGKSTLAAGLADALDATLLRSDEVRKELAGLPIDHPAPAAFGEGIYSPGATVATYRSMLDRAGVALAMGETVVLDASWTSAGWREEARQLAQVTAADLVELRCELPAAVAAERMARRAVEGGDPSDADAGVAADLAALAAPWPSATVIDTQAAPTAALARAVAAVLGTG